VTVSGATRLTLYPLPSSSSGGIFTALTAGAIGDIYLDFQTFSYYKIVSCGTSTSGFCLQNPNAQAFTIPAANAASGIAYAVDVVNLNPLQKTISLDNFTYLFQFWGQGSSFRGAGWFILSNSSDTNINRVYTPITLVFNVTTTLVFGDSGGCPPAAEVSPFSPERTGGSCAAPSPGLASTFIFAHGWKGIPISSTPNYGQNIPFVTTLYS
jgi:hypothetical protein